MVSFVISSSERRNKDCNNKKKQQHQQQQYSRCSYITITITLLLSLLVGTTITDSSSSSSNNLFHNHQQGKQNTTSTTITAMTKQQQQLLFTKTSNNTSNNRSAITTTTTTATTETGGDNVVVQAPSVVDNDSTPGGTTKLTSTILRTDSNSSSSSSTSSDTNDSPKSSSCCSCCDDSKRSFTRIVSNRRKDRQRQRPMTNEQQIDQLLWNQAKYKRSKVNDNITNTDKRLTYLSWDEYFMYSAILSSYRSKDPSNNSRRVGCCIVDTQTNHIIGTGYSGFPIGCSDDILPWTTTSTTTDITNNNTTSTTSTNINWLHTAEPYVVPAEINAILNKCSDTCYNGKLYTTRYPTNDCAKLIIQSGITEVIYLVESTETTDDNDNNNDTDGIKNHKNLVENDNTNNNDTIDDDDDDNDDDHIYYDDFSVENLHDDKDTIDVNVRASRILFQLAGVRTRAFRHRRHRSSSSSNNNNNKYNNPLILNFTKVLVSNGSSIGTIVNDNDEHDDNTENNNRIISTNNILLDQTISKDTVYQQKELQRQQQQQKQIQEQTLQRHRDIMLKEANYDVFNPPLGTMTKLQTTTKESSDILTSTTSSSLVLSWDDYFMGMAFLTAQRSKDPNTQVGACIVDPTSKKILGLGYNGFPKYCSDDILPWARTVTSDSSIPEQYKQLHTKYMYVVHAEQNAILNKGSANVIGSTIYVALFPCNDCTKVLIQSGIKEIVYMNDPYYNTSINIASRILLQMCNITVRQHIPDVPCIELSF